MKTIIVEKIPQILENKKKLERELDIKITNKGEEIFVDGKPEDEYFAEKIIDALDFGFTLPKAILIKKEDFIFEILNIKDYTKRDDLKKVRARIIGKKGVTLKTLCELTNCHFELKDNFVGIIGSPENIRQTQEAIISIIRGSKQSNVYARLEKSNSESTRDLGLK